jgi:excisionase family DNA binding protein
LTVADVAELLKFNPQTIRNWIDQGSLPAVRVGRGVRIKQSDLDRILGAREEDVEPSAPPGETASTRGPKPETAQAVLARNRFAAALAETIRVAASPSSNHLSSTLRALATAAQNLATALDSESRDTVPDRRDPPLPLDATYDAVTHRVTTKDIEAGQIRIPPATKELFPAPGLN